MKYVLAFVCNTGSYRVHAETCRNAVQKIYTKNDQTVFEERFNTIEEAHAHADADESEKAGEPTKASFKVCTCAKVKV